MQVLMNHYTRQYQCIVQCHSNRILVQLRHSGLKGRFEKAFNIACVVFFTSQHKYWLSTNIPPTNSNFFVCVVILDFSPKFSHWSQKPTQAHHTFSWLESPPFTDFDESRLLPRLTLITRGILKSTKRYFCFIKKLLYFPEAILSNENQSVLHRQEKSIQSSPWHRAEHEKISENFNIDL